MKRFVRPMPGFRSLEEKLAIIGKPGASWTSQRDHVLLHMLYNTGARVSEIIDVRLADVVVEGAACVHSPGKGPKRTMPLWRSTVKAIRSWLRHDPRLMPRSALLPNRDGPHMTPSNVAQRLALAVATATPALPSLRDRYTSPHAVPHTAAMQLLQSGESIEGIALWLSHEGPTTTHQLLARQPREEGEGACQAAGPQHPPGACGPRPHCRSS
jgi:site-specific recombinase XerD